MTIDEFKESMTIYYSKLHGIIRDIITGAQDMSMYGDMQDEMEMIQDYLVVPFDKGMFENKKNYKIDLATKTVIKIMDSQISIEINDIKNENIKLKDMLEKQNQAIAELSLLLVPPVEPIE